jgi:hypothetical protein
VSFIPRPQLAGSSAAGDLPVQYIHTKKLPGAKDIHYIGQNLFVNQRA